MAETGGPTGGNTFKSHEGWNPVIQYTSGYKYQLHQNAVFMLPAEFAGAFFDSGHIALMECKLLIRAGYAWDGASGPTWDSKNSMQGSLVHDALYQAIRLGLLPRALKKESDDLLQSICISDGMSRIRAGLWHRAVQKFGLSSTIKNKNILVAP